MKKNIYAMKDELRGFLSPFVEINDDVAMRSFGYAMTSNDIIGFRPQDFSLYKLGKMDEESGILEPLSSPKFIMNALPKGEE